MLEVGGPGLTGMLCSKKASGTQRLLSYFSAMFDSILKVMVFSRSKMVAPVPVITSSRKEEKTMKGAEGREWVIYTEGSQIKTRALTSYWTELSHMAQKLQGRWDMQFLFWGAVCLANNWKFCYWQPLPLSLTSGVNF